jgi:hypothetical protein
MLEILPGFSRNGLHDDKVRQNFIDNNHLSVAAELLSPRRYQSGLALN